MLTLPLLSFISHQHFLHFMLTLPPLPFHITLSPLHVNSTTTFLHFTSTLPALHFPPLEHVFHHPFHITLSPLQIPSLHANNSFITLSFMLTLPLQHFNIFFHYFMLTLPCPTVVFFGLFSIRKLAASELCCATCALCRILPGQSFSAAVRWARTCSTWGTGFASNLKRCARSSPCRDKGWLTGGEGGITTQSGVWTPCRSQAQYSYQSDWPPPWKFACKKSVKLLFFCCSIYTVLCDLTTVIPTQ